MHLVDKLVEEEHHLEDIAREGYKPSTMPIVLVAILLAVTLVVVVVLTIALAAYYFA
jgi:hypothetical protein